jgi:predicted tellurium resistance membrane protein TerC
MWRELRTTSSEAHAAAEALADQDIDSSGGVADSAPRKTFRQAAWQIVIADVSMSLDNVLAVAGAALDHPYVLVFGLVLSIALMGIAASFIARLLQKHRWIAYVGLIIILYVALSMVWDGAHQYFGQEVVAELVPRLLLPWLSTVSNVDLLAELCAAEAASSAEIAEARLPPRRAAADAEA